VHRHDRRGHSTRPGRGLQRAGTDTKLGLALGVTIVVKLGTAEYRNEVTDAMPAGIPPGTAEAAPDTLGVP
jgi:DHA2 family multidrug resistance protein-like MFS transporter